MKILKYVFAIVLLGTAMPMITACDDNDAGYEEMGDKIGDTGDNVGDAIGDTSDEVGDKIDDTAK